MQNQSFLIFNIQKPRVYGRGHHHHIGKEVVVEAAILTAFERNHFVKETAKVWWEPGALQDVPYLQQGVRQPAHVGDTAQVALECKCAIRFAEEE